MVEARDIIAHTLKRSNFGIAKWQDIAAIVLADLTAAGWTLAPPGKVAKACKTCNAPRAVSPCFKCGGELFEPADGWEWPALPPIDRIRELAREVGYAIGVHGSQERDLDLMALPWREDAVAPKELAEHIASGLGGKVLTSNDKHPGRWACNINIDGWYKLIDLSVAVIAPPGSRVVREGGVDAGWQPIETAPFTFDDGRRWLTWCLLWVPDQYGGLAIVGGMNADEWLWRDDERACAGFQTAPTHWRHLPEPPALRALAEAKP